MDKTSGIHAETAKIFAVMILVLLASFGSVRAQTAATAHPDHIPTNDDVLLMVRFHASERKILDAINGAPRVDFDTTPDGVAKLASAGTSSAVIAAMMKKESAQSQTASGTPAAPAAPASQNSSSIGSVPPEAAMGRARAAMMMGTQVALHTTEGDKDLSARRGQLDMTGMSSRLLGLAFLQYPGAAAKARTSERRPSLLLRSENDPHDKQEASYSFLVKLDPSTKNDERSLKIGHAFGNRSTTAAANPDKDWTIEYDATQESAGVWRVTPRADLAPGEYGLYMNMFTLYDFGVDK